MLKKQPGLRLRKGCTVSWLAGVVAVSVSHFLWLSIPFPGSFQKLFVYEYCDMVEFFNVIQLCLVEMVDEVDVPHFAKIHQNNATHLS